MQDGPHISSKKVNQHPHPPTLEQIASVIRKEVQPIRNTINSFERRLSEMNGTMMEEHIEDIAIRLANLENETSEQAGTAGTPRSDDTTIWEHIKTLEGEVSQLKVSGKTQRANQSNTTREAKRDLTAVIGQFVGIDSK